MRKYVKTFAALPMVATMSIASAAGAAVDYGSPGSRMTSQSTLASGEGGSTGGYLVVPSGSGPFPLIVASHGWSATADQQVGWATHFASWGFVVVAPSFPDTLTPNDQTDAQIIAALAKLYADPSHASPAQGKVDGSRLGLEGHSAGGLATTIASASIRPRATVLFDPVDSNDDGKNALPKVCGPLLGVFADPSSCNNEEGWWPHATGGAGPEVLFHVVSSTHCDGENAPRSLCGGVCGGAADSTRQTVYARYATAFFLAHLAGDATAASTLGIGALSGDSAIKSAIVKPGPDCTVVGTDAGAPPPDAGVLANEAGSPLQPDAGSAPPVDADAPSTEEASTPAQGADSPQPGSVGAGDSGGCACSSAGSPRDAAGGVALAVGLTLLAVRRREGARWRLGATSSNVRKSGLALLPDTPHFGFQLRVLGEAMGDEVFAPSRVHPPHGAGEDSPAELDGFRGLSIHRDPLSVWSVRSLR